MTAKMVPCEQFRIALRFLKDVLLSQGFQPDSTAISRVDILLSLLDAAPAAASAQESSKLAFELDGVIADVELGNGFDMVCLRTVKRVRDALRLAAPAPPASAPVPEEAAKDERQSEAYPRCTEVLRHSGKPYPRTCQECGLGPCKRKSPAPVPASELVQRLRAEVAAAEREIANMPKELADMPDSTLFVMGITSILKLMEEAAAAIECRGEAVAWMDKETGKVANSHRDLADQERTVELIPLYARPAHVEGRE